MFCKLKIDIVRAQREDYNEIISMWNICFPTPENPEIVRQNLSISQNFVAKVDGKIVGAVSYSKYQLYCRKVVESPSYRRDKMCLVWGLAVLPEYRRHGIGEQLMQAVESDMYRNGAKGYREFAASEEVAQWLVRKFGVRIKRLALRQLVAEGVFNEKKFRQEGVLEDLKKTLRKVFSLLLKKTYTRIKAALLEYLQKR